MHHYLGQGFLFQRDKDGVKTFPRMCVHMYISKWGWTCNCMKEPVLCLVKIYKKYIWWLEMMDVFTNLCLFVTSFFSLGGWRKMLRFLISDAVMESLFFSLGDASRHAELPQQLPCSHEENIQLNQLWEAWGVNAAALYPLIYLKIQIWHFQKFVKTGHMRGFICHSSAEMNDSRANF